MRCPKILSHICNKAWEFVMLSAILTTSFQNAELFHVLIQRTKRWLELGANGLSKEPRFNGQFPKTLPEEAYQKIWKVWRGQVWRICVTFTYRAQNGDLIDDIDRNKSYFVYERPTYLMADEDAVPLPALQHMNPTSQIKDRKELGVHIREHVEFSKAWIGADHNVLGTDGGFHYNFVDEVRPFFKSDEEVLECHALTDYVGRDYFNTVIDLLITEWEKWETELFLFLQGLIKLVKDDTGEEEFEEGNSFVGKVEY